MSSGASLGEKAADLWVVWTAPTDHAGYFSPSGALARWCYRLGCPHYCGSLWSSSWSMYPGLRLWLLPESQAYSIAGGIFLLLSGQYFFFVDPEWYVIFFKHLPSLCSSRAQANLWWYGNWSWSCRSSDNVGSFECKFGSSSWHLDHCSSTNRQTHSHSHHQRSYIWIRVVKFMWPFVIVLSAIRAILMIVQLQRGSVSIV